MEGGCCPPRCARPPSPSLPSPPSLSLSLCLTDMLAVPMTTLSYGGGGSSRGGGGGGGGGPGSDAAPNDARVCTASAGSSRLSDANWSGSSGAGSMVLNGLLGADGVCERSDGNKKHSPPPLALTAPRLTHHTGAPSRHAPPVACGPLPGRPPGCQSGRCRTRRSAVGHWAPVRRGRSGAGAGVGDGGAQGGCCGGGGGTGEAAAVIVWGAARALGLPPPSPPSPPSPPPLQTRLNALLAHFTPSTKKR